MIREWTSFFVAVFSLIYIYELSLFASGAKDSALALMRNPGIIAFNVLALLLTLYHAFTWFYLIGKVQPIKMGKTTSKPWQALLVNIVLLLIISYAVIQILVLRYHLMPKVARLHAILWVVFSLGGFIAAFV